MLGELLVRYQDIHYWENSQLETEMPTNVDGIHNDYMYLLDGFILLIISLFWFVLLFFKNSSYLCWDTQLRQLSLNWINMCCHTQ